MSDVNPVAAPPAAHARGVPLNSVDVSPAKTFSGPPTVRYNPDKDRERVRGVIARILVLLLVAVVLVAMVAAFVVPASDEDFREILNILIPPIVALVGSVTGFYFGQKSSSSDGAGE